MTSEFCPKCGAARTGAFKFCRGCGFDFEAGGGLAAVAPTEAAPSAAPIPADQTGASSYLFRTIGLGLVLALLVVPFGGPYTLPALVLIAALVAFDLWRNRLRVEAVARGEVQRPGFVGRPARQRLAIVVLGFVAVILVLLAAMRVAGTL